MKKWILGIIGLSLLGVIGGILGYQMYDRQQIEQTPAQGEIRLAEEEQEKENTLIAVAAVTPKVQPNTNILHKAYYTKCDHLIQEEALATPEMVNKTEEELQKLYPDKTIEAFSEQEVILYQKYVQWCPKHFVLREDDGRIVIYRLNAQGKESVLEKTEILVDYLPEQDQERLREGIAIVGEETLNATLEDFE